MVTRSAAMLTAAGVESVRTLVELQKSPNAPATRLQAAEASPDGGAASYFLSPVVFDGP